MKVADILGICRIKNMLRVAWDKKNNKDGFYTQKLQKSSAYWFFIYLCQIFWY